MKSNPAKVAMRIRKDGGLDRRFAMAKRLVKNGSAHIWEEPIKSGKAIPRRKPQQKDSLLDRFCKWVFWGVLFLGVPYTALTTPSNSFDASLYKSVYAKEEVVIESKIEASRVYLENPRTIEEIKNYIKYKFGNNYQIACMVAYGEGLRTNWINKTPYEWSVGVYQINLAGMYGRGWKVHWDKVPGNTLEEKTAWLQIPKNNVDLAYKMSNGGNDWQQWSAWTNGSALKFADECQL